MKIKYINNEYIMSITNMTFTNESFVAILFKILTRIFFVYYFSFNIIINFILRPVYKEKFFFLIWNYKFMIITRVTMIWQFILRYNFFSIYRMMIRIMTYASIYVMIIRTTLFINKLIITYSFKIITNFLCFFIKVP